MDLSEKLILGTYTIFDEKEALFIHAATLHQILEKYDANEKDIVGIIRENPQRNRIWVNC